jgi:acetyl coenzyme A synthetase (ADP forming)-like protein
MCPPRCPRFITAGGTAVLIETVDGEPEKTIPTDLSFFSGPERGPDDLVLAASVENRVVGYAWLRPVAGGGRHCRLGVTKSFEDDELTAELARQAVAYAIADGASRLSVEDTGLFERAGLEVKRSDSEPYVSLTTPAVQQVTTAPARNDSRPTPASETPSASKRRKTGEQSPETTPAPPPTSCQGRDLSGLFVPDSVAVVGATDREGSIGRLLLENLDEYPGEVIPVTPHAESVFGQDAPDSLAEATAVDLPIIALAPEDALAALETAGKSGIENAVVVSAGFEEAGEDGNQYATELKAIAQRYELNVVGPNSMGVMSTASGLNASFSPRHPVRGSISLISQSGAFITASLANAADRGLGFRHVVSVGNKTVLDAVDYLQYLDEDPETDVIAAYLEDIERGSEFVDVARKITRSTPIVVLKPGKTDQGASAAASHTGSLASEDTAVEAAFERAGVIRASSAGELFDYAATLRGTVPDGDTVGVITNAGGPGVLAADAIAAEGANLAELSDKTRNHLTEFLPPTAAVGTPTDVLGDADIERFGNAIDAILGDPGVDIGLVVTTPHPLIDYNELATIVGRHSQIHDTPVVTCFMDGDFTAATKRALRRYSVANYDDPSRAASAIGTLSEYTRERDRPPVTPPRELVDVDEERIQQILETHNSLGSASFGLLEACGIDVPEWGVADTPADVSEIAERIGTSVVLKVVSQDIVHKVDVGGVRLDISPEAAEQEARELLAEVRDSRPEATITGILVQEFADRNNAIETVIGATDSRFGPLVTFGLGGVLVEHVEDVSFALAPLDYESATALVQDIEASGILDGARGTSPADLEALAETLVRLAALLAVAPQITAVDLNPVFVDENGVTAVDFHAELSSP